MDRSLRGRRLAWVGLLWMAAACGDDGSGSDTSADTEGAGSTGSPGGESEAGSTGGGGTCLEPVNAEAFELPEACAPSAQVYQPTGSDDWPACVTDDGDYHLVGDTPGTIGRVEGFEEMMDVLYAAETPTPDDFTMARTIYAEEEGLESRLQVREDLHFDPIPMEDWDPGVRADRQCGVADNAERYPDRCAGPARIAPIISEAFAAGQQGEGTAEVHRARIEAAVLWFLYLSVYKEANTCFTSNPADCDSSWAYYTGGAARDGGLGLSAAVREASATAHAPIYDGVLAFRCLRELAPADEDPSLEDLAAEDAARFEAAVAQLDEALAHGVARIVRERLVAQTMVCDVEAQANWAFLQVLGPVLDPEGNRRDAEAYAPAEMLWTSAQPTQEAVESAIEAVDTVFDCPFPE